MEMHKSRNICGKRWFADAQSYMSKIKYHTEYRFSIRPKKCNDCSQVCESIWHCPAKCNNMLEQHKSRNLEVKMVYLTSPWL